MTQIVILAAGKGTRMNSELPKVLVPLNGRPMISYLMDSVVASGIDVRPIIVVSPDNKEIINKALEEYNLDYIFQEKILGTGHAVACTKNYIKSETDNIIVLYGDHPFLTSESIKKFATLKHDALTIMPAVLPDFEGWHHNFYHWGRIVRGDDGLVEGIVELKDTNDEQKLITEVNPGFMCFNKKWLFENIDKLKDDNKAQEFYLTDMVKIAFQEGYKVGTIEIEAREAMGINSLEELKIAEGLLG
ncbi:MAG: NTP transferase domain-containing protein [Patescibacteria group bacterium]|jgi:bifunctional UDP-N-acetylglucosamine pyrophosphorylase/glucosamine-1-phosphate N-acetyltransferase